MSEGRTLREMVEELNDAGDPESLAARFKQNVNLLVLALDRLAEWAERPSQRKYEATVAALRAFNGAVRAAPQPDKPRDPLTDLCPHGGCVLPVNHDGPHYDPAP